MPRTKYSTDDYSTGPMSPASPGPQSPGRPLHSPSPLSPLSPFTPTSLSPKPEHSPLKPPSPVPYGSPHSQSRSPAQTPTSKETANWWSHNSFITAPHPNQNSHLTETPSANQSSTARAVSPSTRWSASSHKTAAIGANTDPLQVCLTASLRKSLHAHTRGVSVKGNVAHHSSFRNAEHEVSTSFRAQNQTRFPHPIDK